MTRRGVYPPAKGWKKDRRRNIQANRGSFFEGRDVIKKGGGLTGGNLFPEREAIHGE